MNLYLAVSGDSVYQYQWFIQYLNPSQFHSENDNQIKTQYAANNENKGIIQ